MATRWPLWLYLTIMALLASKGRFLVYRRFSGNISLFCGIILRGVDGTRLVSHAEEKTESPSEYKLKQARNKGMVAKSGDVVVWASLLSGFLICYVASWAAFIKLQVFLRTCLRSFSYSPEILKQALDLWLILSLPVVFAAACGGFVGNVAQFGFLLTGHPIKPYISRLNPVNGLKKLLSKDRFVDLLKQITKFIIVFFVVIYCIKKHISTIVLLFRVEMVEAISVIASLVVDVFIRVLLAFLCVALFDWFWSRFSFYKSMRMSKYEVKKEYKQQEGDPHIKQERRRMHQEALEGPLSPSLEDASVVITNPSHLAVAIVYHQEKDDVPKVLDKGMGKKAKAMMDLAHQCHIPIIRNVPLVRDLQWLDIHEEIPKNLYDSVAEVLLFVHELAMKNSEQQHEDNP